MAVTAYLGIGSNLGDKEENLRAAVNRIRAQAGNIISCSAPYLSAPWGFESENNFINIAVSVETALSPFDLLHITQQIEKELGRTRKSVNGIYTDRIIDIDILFYGDEFIDTDRLVIPHPGIGNRDFFRIPLREIYPGFETHPAYRLRCQK